MELDAALYIAVQLESHGGPLPKDDAHTPHRTARDATCYDCQRHTHSSSFRRAFPGAWTRHARHVIRLFHTAATRRLHDLQDRYVVSFFQARDSTVNADVITY